MARRKQELTPGEADVLNLIERGNAVDQIAEAKDISKPAVYHYIRRLKNKGHLHPDQRIPSRGSAETPVVVAPSNHVGDNGVTTNADGDGGRYGYEIAFDTLLKSSTAVSDQYEKLAAEVAQTEEMLGEMKERLTLLEQRRNSLRNAGKALVPELVDTSQFAVAE